MTKTATWTALGLSALVLAAKVVWIELDGATVSRYHEEDEIFENLTALFFGLGGVFLIVTAFRTPFLRGRGPAAYFLTVSLALLLIFLAGEEISWGQRIIGIETPELIRERNLNEEINIHNLWFIEEKIQISLIIFSLVIGVFLPAIAMTRFGRQLMHKFCCPAPPWPYAILFVGSIIVGSHYLEPGSPIDPLYNAKEIREFLLATAVFFFTVHGLLDRAILFRLTKAEASLTDSKGGG